MCVGSLTFLWLCEERFSLFFGLLELVLPLGQLWVGLQIRLPLRQWNVRLICRHAVTGSQRSDPIIRSGWHRDFVVVIAIHLPITICNTIVTFQIFRFRILTLMKFMNRFTNDGKYIYVYMRGPGLLNLGYYNFFLEFYYWENTLDFPLLCQTYPNPPD